LNNRVSALPEAGIGGTSSDDALVPDDVAPEETFKDVLRYIKSDYVERAEDEKKLGFGAVKSMLASLDDPKTRFFDPAQRRQLLDQLDGRFSGIGAAVTVVKQRKGAGQSAIDQRRLAVVAPIPGGAADRAGLLPGDVISEIDGKWVIAYDPRLELDQMFGDVDEGDKKALAAAKEATDRLAKGISLPRALEILNGSEGKSVALSIDRAGVAQPIRLTVAAGPSVMEPVEYRSLGANSGYLRVTQFNDRATAQFSAALACAKISILVIDLRGNVGGPVTGRQTGTLGSALALIGKVAGPGTAGSIVRKGNRIESLSSSVPAAGRFRIAVLVNGGTANLAEMVAASLRERANATVLGSRTFGDSVYQKLVELREGAGMTVTTGKLLSGRGADFTGRGVPIDVSVSTGGPRPDDAVVQRAVNAG
jgi:carboxyl-terminal processing protease